MTIDNYQDTAKSVSAPAAVCFAIVPSDDMEIAQATKALYIGVGGTVTLRSVGSAADVTFVGLASGSLLPVRVCAVRNTGTTAAGLVGLA